MDKRQVFSVLLAIITTLLIAIGSVSLAVYMCSPGDQYTKPSVEHNRLYALPKGMKLINVTDKSYGEFGVLVRPMRSDEKAETYTWWRVNNGNSVTIKETR